MCVKACWPHGLCALERAVRVRSPGWGNCVVLLRTTLFSHSAFVNSSVQMRTSEFHAVNNPAMDWIMGQRHVITGHIEEHGAHVHEPSQHFLDHCLFTYKVCVLLFLSLSCANPPQYVYSIRHLQGARAAGEGWVGLDVLPVILCCR